MERMPLRCQIGERAVSQAALVVLVNHDAYQPPTGRIRYDLGATVAIAADAFRGALADLKAIEADLGALEAELERLGAPHTPGRVPEWGD